MVTEPCHVLGKAGSDFDLGGLHNGIDLSARWGATTLKGTEESAMHSQSHELQGSKCSPARIRATWDGTGSVADASRALGFSRAKGYDLVRRGEFPCRVLRVGHTTRVVTASLLRVLESGEPEYNGPHASPCTRS
ncbi:helix-turn-helix domain-containing protein [Streptomyces sp. NPDC091292]|uniref:helix-turn-helix domain-containing protein n=1 Tax=Streptomyces sp. NPDC091292 TaxID=3365991 RepID=UPI0037F9513B